MHFRLNDGHCGNSGDGDSSHGSTTVAVTQLIVDALNYHKTFNKRPQRLLEHGPQNPGV